MYDPTGVMTKEDVDEMTKNIIDRIEVVPINDTEMKLQIRLMTGASDSMTYTKKGRKTTRRSGNISKMKVTELQFLFPPRKLRLSDEESAITYHIEIVA